MKVLIIEDEPLAVERMEKLLYEIGGLEVAGIAGSVAASLEWLQKMPEPELILMDIELEDGQCFSIFDKVTVNSPVIFTTSYDEYAIRAFKVNSIDYLLKPVKTEDLKAAINKLKTLGNHLPTTNAVVMEQLLRQFKQPVKEYRERFLVKSGQRYFSVETTDIAYFFYKNRVTFLRTWNKEVYFLDYLLDDLEEMLSPKTFFRVNRQYLCHVKSVKDIHSYFNNKLKLTLQPASDEEVLVSREKALEFKNFMGR